MVNQAIMSVVIGGALSLALSAPLVIHQYRRFGRFSAGRAAWSVGAVVYLTALIAYTLFPLPDMSAEYCAHRPHEFLLDPTAYFSDMARHLAGQPLQTALASWDVRQMVLNVALFAPLGLLCGDFLEWGALRSLATGFGVSLAIELTQYTGNWGLAPCQYRVADINDLITNTVGTGVGIGIVTSNNDSELPTTTPVVTITSTPSGSPSSPQSSPSQAPSSQDPSSAPVLEQSQAPQQPVEVQSAPEQTTGPEPEKNIVERIIDTLASIPQWVIDQFTHQDPPAEPEQTTPPSESPSQTPTNSAPSPTNSAPSTSSDPSKAPSSEASSSASPNEAPSSGGTTPKCRIKMEWKDKEGKTHQVYYADVDCTNPTPTPQPHGGTSDSPPDADPTDLTCTLITTQEEESTATPSSQHPIQCPPVPR